MPKRPTAGDAGWEWIGFSFAMILGVLIGTYSSIFVASPMLKFFKVT